MSISVTWGCATWNYPSFIKLANPFDHCLKLHFMKKIVNSILQLLLQFLASFDLCFYFADTITFWTMQLNAATKTLLNYYQSLIAVSCCCSRVVVRLFCLCLHWNASCPWSCQNLLLLKYYMLYYKFRVEIFFPTFLQTICIKELCLALFPSKVEDSVSLLAHCLSSAFLR